MLCATCKEHDSIVSLTQSNAYYKTIHQQAEVKAASWVVLSTVHVHCDSTGSEPHFGGGTKLTVLGKKSDQCLNGI